MPSGLLSAQPQEWAGPCQLTVSRELVPRACLALPWLSDPRETWVLVWTLPIWDANLCTYLLYSSLGDFLP